MIAHRYAHLSAFGREFHRIADEVFNHMANFLEIGFDERHVGIDGAREVDAVVLGKRAHDRFHHAHYIAELYWLA